MCGILGVFDANALSADQLRTMALACSKKLRHRGPDWSGAYTWEQDSGTIVGHDVPQAADAGTVVAVGTCKSAALVHERLAIVDPESGAQPLYNADHSVVLSANGEIYNHMELRKELTDYVFQTHSDCEVMIPLYEKYGKSMVAKLDGMFAFIIWDQTKRQYMAARDHMGILPMYIGFREDGGVMFASEMKALIGQCERFELFPPGHVYTSELGKFERWYDPIWRDVSKIPSMPLELAELRSRFEHAVIKRMMSDVPWGVLLSGGLDSSLVSSVCARHAARRNQAWPKMHSFSIGLEGSPDLAAAKRVADFLGTTHHPYTFSVQDGIDAIPEVIYHLETYDITTIRAATPMFLMARKIKAMGVKMVLSGEGADEAMAGYLYFHKAPNKEKLHLETVSKLENLHYFDCLRANKSMSAFGVEPRVPFLDKDFLAYVMSIDPEEKMCKVRAGDEKRGSIEKFMLRKAFDDPADPYLPEDVLWRQKEQFSDGVGYNWIDSLRAKATREVSDAQWKSRANRFPYNTPPTKEGYYYRAVFEGHYPAASARETVPGGPSVACSTAAAIEWDESFKLLASSVGGDNSGRAVLGVHNDAYKDAAGVISGTVAATDGDDAAPDAKKARVEA